MATHRVVYGFTGGEGQKISVSVGELITVLSTSNNWCTVRRGDIIGLVPLSYLEPLLSNEVSWYYTMVYVYYGICVLYIEVSSS